MSNNTKGRPLAAFVDGDDAEAMTPAQIARRDANGIVSRTPGVYNQLATRTPEPPAKWKYGYADGAQDPNLM